MRVPEAADLEVDEHDGGGPVEVREALVPEVDHVEDDGHEHAVEGDCASRRVRVRAADAVAVEEAACTLARGRDEREDLDDLAAEADDEQERHDQDHVRVVELQLRVQVQVHLHVACIWLFNKARGRHQNYEVVVLKTAREGLLENDDVSWERLGYSQVVRRQA